MPTSRSWLSAHEKARFPHRWQPAGGVVESFPFGPLLSLSSPMRHRRVWCEWRNPVRSAAMGVEWEGALDVYRLPAPLVAAFSPYTSCAHGQACMRAAQRSA